MDNGKIKNDRIREILYMNKLKDQKINIELKNK